MNKPSKLILLFSVLVFSHQVFCQSDSIVLRDISWDKQSPAGFAELRILSDSSLLAGLMYKANGNGKHPTLLLLHGYPGNERNLDLAQMVRAHGWNVIYFNYRGAWGTQGKFSFRNCVDDVVNVVSYCNKYQNALKIDTSNIVLFGHSMGGWVCLKSLERLPQIKKGFVLSAWDIYGDVQTSKKDKFVDETSKYFVLNATPEEIFDPVMKQPEYFKLENTAVSLSSKQIIMIDEHNYNKGIAENIKKLNKTYFEYQVWNTDHSFTNKRISLANKLIWFLDK